MAAFRLTRSSGPHQPPRDPREEERLPLDELPDELPPDDDPPERTEPELPELPELREPPPLDRTPLPDEGLGCGLDLVSVLFEGGGEEEPLDRTPWDPLREPLLEPDERTP